jgi:dsDNA-specific endonuclease/ATPase MutS2
MFKVGDRVVFKDDVGGGVVSEISNGSIYVLTEDDFGDWFKPEELLLADDKQINEDAGNPSVPTKVESLSYSSKPHSKNHEKAYEVDLHLHNLIENSLNMTNHEKVIIQLNAAKNAYQKAKAKRFKYLKLIHGKGSGKLRSELHQWLRSIQVLDFYDIDISGNQSGVTEVRMF